MSKASEWAALSHRLANSPAGGFSCRAIKTLLDRDGTTTDAVSIHVGVGWRAVGENHVEPTFNWTDWRLGGVQLGSSEALALAKWITDTFADPEAPPHGG